jgi:hypothetical protein
MKKTVALFALTFLLAAAAWADHPSGSALGLTLGGGGGTFGSGLVGFNFKLSGVPVFFTVSGSFGGYGAGLAGSGDIYFIDADLIPEEDFNIDWFLGGGAYVNAFFGDATYVGAGGRLPVGLSWHIVPKAELALAVIPALGLGFGDFGVRFPVWNVGGELTIRYWPQ